MQSEIVGVLAFAVEGTVSFLQQEPNAFPDMRPIASGFKNAVYNEGGSMNLAIILFCITIWENSSNHNPDPRELVLFTFIAFFAGMLWLRYKAKRGRKPLET